MQKQPLLIMLACFISGVFFYENFWMSENAVYIFAATAGFFAVISVLIKNFWIQKLRNFLLGIFFVATGIFSHFIQIKKDIPAGIAGKQNFIFKIDKKLNSSEKYRRYEVSILKLKEKSADQKLPIRAVISLPKNLPQLDFKNYYQAESYLNKVEPPTADFQFDYAKYLARKDIFFQSFINDGVISTPRNDLVFSEKIKQKRLDILYNIDHSSLQPKTREFLKGIILADRTEMDAETVSDFSKSGLVHLLAISGSHMVIIFMLVMLILGSVIPHKFRNLQIILALALIWAFAIFIDYGPSVVRSCIMISAYYSFVLLQLRPSLLHAIALAGFGILMFDTQQLFDVGFQLSFLAVLGIFWLNQPILNLFGTLRTKWKRFLASIISVSLSAQIATLPLVIFYFHQYSLISILANFAIIPFSEIIIIFSLIMTVFFAFNLNLHWLEIIYDFSVNWLLKAIHWFAGFDFVFAKNIGISILEVAALFVVAYYLRFLLLKINFRTMRNFALTLLAFFAIRMAVNFSYINKEEILTANNFKQKILVLKKNQHADFYIKGKTDAAKIRKSVIDPYLSSRRIADFEIKKFPENSEKAVVNGKIYELK